MVKSTIRTFTFFGKWLAELVQQPALMLSLIAGPFLILLTFGAGIQAMPPEPDVIVVADESSQMGGELVDEIRDRFNVVAITDDLDRARRMLFTRRAEAVVVLPSEPERSFEQGQHAEILVLTNDVDPARHAYTHAHLGNQVHGLNQQMTRGMILDAQESTEEMRSSINEARQLMAQAHGLPGNPVSDDLHRLNEQLESTAAIIDRFAGSAPELASAPFQLEVDNLARLSPSYTAFYGAAVLALLLQHLAVTLGALTMTRIRLLGVMDLLRVSPVRPIEMVTGHYLSYAVLCGIAAAALTALLILGLNVPLFGSLALFATTIGLLTISSLGIGFVIASVSASEQQSAQMTMLVLLASIFFSGLLFPLEQIVWPAQAISYVLPATYGIRSVQDVMLRGDLQPLPDLAVLGGAAVALFALTVFLMRREWRPD